ncbi:MAG: hypothetical protein ACRDL6_04795 [Solirubrobacterales bacterium]
MIATYGAALLIIVSSLFVGRAFFALFGRRETGWLETSVGLAVLIVACSVFTRIGEDATVSVLGCAILLAASAAYLRFGFADRESLVMGAPVVVLVLLLASLPFIASGHFGIPGVGVNNDMAAHLLWADYLQNSTGPEPSGIVDGYPLGPHGLVATIAQLLGTEPLYGFLGLLLALPVLTGLTTLNVLHGLSPLRRTAAALLVALAYMSASTLGIAGFKELILSLFLIAYVLILRTLAKEPEGRFPLIAALGALVAGIIATYSFPGLAWPAAATGVWIVAELVVLVREGRLEELREGLRRNARALVGAGLVLVVLAATQVPRLLDFIDSGIYGTVRGTDSKLRFDVSPLEALGSWPSGEFLFGTTGIGGSALGIEAWVFFGALGVIALVVALAWWLRRGDVTLPAAVAGAGLVYLGTLLEGGRYVQGKAIAVPAALIMLLIVGALLAQQGSRWRLLIAIPFVAVAAYSSFLALRDSVIAPTARFDELKALRGTVEGETVLTLTTDRFSDYGLRSGEVYSPAKNAERKVRAQVTKEFRLPVDFDSVPYRTLNKFSYAITTGAVYQSKAPPGWTEVAAADSYRLWERTGTTPPIAILYEEARPGRVFRCKNPKLAAFLGGGGDALIWPRPVIAKRLYWEPTSRLEPGRSASQTINLAPGVWDLSLQYTSPVVGVEIEGPGFEAELPAGVEAAIPFRAREGPFWRAGRITSPGGPLTFTVRAKGLSRLQRLLGVDATANIGNLTAVASQEVHSQPLATSCYLYVDKIVGARQPRGTKPQRR